MRFDHDSGEGNWKVHMVAIMHINVLSITLRAIKSYGQGHHLPYQSDVTLQGGACTAYISSCFTALVMNATQSECKKQAPYPIPTHPIMCASWAKKVFIPNMANLNGYE